MADTTTTTYSLVKPEVGASEDTWGTKINTNLDNVDNLLDGTTPVTGIDINSGSIDGTPIGANSASTGAFTTISGTTGTFSGAVSGTTGTFSGAVSGTTGTFSGAVSGASATFDGGVDIDNINIDGTTIALSSGDLTLDVAGDITLDADGDEIHFKRGGVNNGKILMASTVFSIGSTENNGDVKIIGIDGGAGITACTFDMSAAGAATFNNEVTATTFNGDGSSLTGITDTTYSAGSGLDLSGTTFSIGSDVRASSNQYFGNSQGEWLYFNNVNDDIRFVVQSSERARLDSNGNFHADGNVVAYSTTISDERLKKDIVKIDNALDKVSQLNGYTFEYLADGKKSAGVIAQEVEKVMPSAITESTLPLKMGDDDKTEYKTVQYDQLHGLMIEAIKELKAEIEELKAR